MIIQHQINDKAAKDIEKLFTLAHEKNLIPSFKSFKSSSLAIKKTYTICNNCSYIKNLKNCEKFNTETPSNNLKIYDLKEQVKTITEINLTEMIENKKNITHLGYLETSIIYKFRKNNQNCFSFTLNTDGLQIFKNNSKDCWPFFLAINELKIKKRYSIANIILAGLWVGTSKINNFVVMNDLMKEIADLEKGILINENLFQFYVLYGSFDKQARALILNSQICTGEMENQCM